MTFIWNFNVFFHRQQFKININYFNLKDKFTFENIIAYGNWDFRLLYTYHVHHLIQVVQS